ncbi:MAG: leucine-rich repeat protein [Clostridiales bacterium]|nr:leucine-rich repeat protein [Clostridiales bacterium]
MKKKIIIVSSLIFAVILIPIILVCFAFGLAPQYDKSFYGGMAVKYNRLKSVEGKKVVIIGGSSVAFGIRSDIMEEQLNMPIVNFGLYANLGTKYMLDVAEDFIAEGDIVIITPEQNSQALSLYFNAEAVWYSVDGCYEILNKIPSGNYGDLAKNFMKFTSGKFNYWNNNNKPDPDGVYNVRSFNAYGDIEYSRPYNTMQNDYDSGMSISFKTEVIATEFIDYLNEYRNKLVNRGAAVYYSFCPMNSSALEENTSDDDKVAYYNYLTEKLNFPIIGNPNTHLLDSGWFYDSNFHLNDAGAVYYSTLLAQEIKAEINDFTPIIADLPDKPQKPGEDGNSSQGQLSQDLTDASKIFNLSGVTVTSQDGEVVLTGAWTIDGLTDYGKSLTEIIIPSTLAGLPVKNIADGCFKDNVNIVKITFGENIATVGRNAFENCVNLSGIYITSLDPDSYHPASDIFDGLDNCAFYVPQEVYATEYAVNYFWGALGQNHLKWY